MGSLGNAGAIDLNSAITRSSVSGDNSLSAATPSSLRAAVSTSSNGSSSRPSTTEPNIWMRRR